MDNKSGFVTPGMGYHRVKGVLLDAVKPGPEWLIVLEHLERRGRGDLVLPSLPNTTRGRVLALGDTVRRETALDVGIDVLFQPYMGGRWQFGTRKGEEARVLIMHMDWVLMGIEESA